VEEAKRDSESRILEALAASHPNGLTFTHLKESTGLHQDTLTNRLEELVRLGLVEREEARRVYLISRTGLLEREKRELLQYIDRTNSYVVSLARDADASPKLPVEHIVYPSITAYAFPDVPNPFLTDLAVALHLQFFSLLVNSLIEQKALKLDQEQEEQLDPKRFVRELKQALRSTSFDRRHFVFAFRIDLGILLERLSEAEAGDSGYLRYVPGLHEKLKGQC
jgi:DNA-binding HxlR family transcriptional regulator